MKHTSLLIIAVLFLFLSVAHSSAAGAALPDSLIITHELNAHQEIFSSVTTDPLLVNDNGDEGDYSPSDGICQTGLDNGICTLRAALGEAGSAPGPDTIEFAPSMLDQTIVLDASPLEVNSEVAVYGPGPEHLTIDANGIHHALHLSLPGYDGGLIYLSGVTVTGAAPCEVNCSGSIGTAVYADGWSAYEYFTVHIENSLVIANTVGGIVALGPVNLILENSEVAENEGGGISLGDAGPGLVLNSTIRDNTAFNAAGIAAGISSIMIAGSTVSGNQASGSGGGLYAGYGYFSIINSTFSGNFAANEGSAIWVDVDPYSILNIQNSTIINNSSPTGSAIHQAADARVKNSVISGNSGDACSPGSAFSGSNNLIDDESCGSLSGRIGAITHFDTELADNGGPTKTHALLRHSSAIDNVADCTIDSDFYAPWYDAAPHIYIPGQPLIEDQRSVPRPQQAACDIGAFEWEYDPVLQEITINAGWNLISSYVIPDDPLFDDIFPPEPWNGLLLCKDAAGHVFWPALGINEIGNWDITQGYQCYAAQAFAILLSGSPVPPGTPIDLSPGWHIVPYWAICPLPVADVTASISSQLVLLKDNYGRIYWPQYGIGQIGDLQPGQAYQVYMAEMGTLLFPPGLCRSDVVQQN